MFVLEYVMTFVLQWCNASGVSCGERTMLAQIVLLLCNLREREITLCRFNCCGPGLSGSGTAARCILFL